MIYYQYGTENYLDALRTGTIRSRMPSELNDPLEFTPCLIKAEYYRMFIREMCERFCLFSFTPEHLSYLMWSYYAAGHSGICVGYDFNSPAFNDITESCKRLFPSEKNGIIDVQYDKPMRPRLDIEKLYHGGPRFGVSFLFELAKYKGSHWSHEKEKRILAPDGGDNSLSIVQKSGEFFFLKAGVESIREVWIGVRANDDMESQIEAIRRDYGGSYTVSRVKLDPQAYCLTE